MASKVKFLAIVQARLGSIRMPNKVLASLGDHSVAELVYHRLRRSQFLGGEIVFAIPDTRKNDALYHHLTISGINVFRGSENDVLKRYFDCSRLYEPDFIVRITCDCPFIDPNLLDQVISYHLASKVDYTSNHFPPTFPDGFDVEVMSRKALEFAHRHAVLESHREHVTLFIKESDHFTKANFENKVDLSNLRVTLDTHVDYKLLTGICEKIQNPLELDWCSLVDIVKADKNLLTLAEHSKYNEGLHMSNGQKLWTRAQSVIAGGNHLLSKNPDMFLPNLWPAYFSKAKGVNIWDLNNQKLLDMSLMGVGTNILGYGNPEFDEAVLETIKNGNLSTLNPPEEVYLAEVLLERNKWAQRVRFARTGGEAAAVAVRLARAASGKDKVAICGYHGWHDWYLSTNLTSADNLNSHLLSGLPINGIPKALGNTTLPFEYNNFSELEKITSEHDIGVIIMEVERNYAPTDNFLQKIRKLASAKNIVLIFDECSSGFRETPGGLFEKYNVEPDIALFGKTLGNGYAITAVVGKDHVMDEINDTFVSSTFWTERIGFSAALRTLEVFEKVEPWKYVTDLGYYLREGWVELAGRYDMEIQISGLPSMSSFNFPTNNNLLYKTYITQELLKSNILSSNTVYLSTVHTREIIDTYIEHLEPLFKEIGENQDSLFILNSLDSEICRSGFKRLN